ncbi:hypothetical protein IC232_03845 [Microvirga sp. BT688]|nr:hypothetical protein [Microvirga sp.]MBD2745824.1 hypothetical protein [Microvirga sp.]
MLVALSLGVVLLVTAVGLLIVQMKDPVAKERLAGLVRYARPKIPMKQGE